ncbi:Na-Ca exchanger/integrin-beta4 [Plesiocystis pacifica SIR-1]|uniref:Na-Ca exchanger/integrin-beta4 n=1 Tax=Plesiocystis pacifica SIR-1 TaxID=391625 RepID=A6G6Z5_9BACT|nr:hypothetical protein [Plesiocystis pacifica]EDM78448.1 Na-Ca exchanger/integrin-beta4 [Plesiocystis pacifica SIR-1]
MNIRTSLALCCLFPAMIACAPAGDEGGDDEVGESGDSDGGTTGGGEAGTTDGGEAGTTGEGEDGTTGEEETTGEEGTTGEEEPVEACSFETTPTSWPLPTPIAGDDLHTLLADYWGCGEGQYRYQLLDLTGDGATDFLVTDNCDSAGVGTDTWHVYANTGSGFASQPANWSLPTPIAGDDLHTLLADYWGCGEGQYRYQLLDLTGDGATDFVVTDNCDAAGVGTDTWHVYANTGSGFAAQPTSWSLPTPIPGDDLHTLLADYWGCGEGQYRYQLLDLTGDGAPDFVVTDNCDAAGVGTDSWQVYANTGSGFAAQPTSWSLPTPIPGDDLHTLLADYWGCGEGQYRYQILDLTGDGAPDFVVTDNCDTAGVGTDTWHVYANTGSGFAAQPTSWSLPTPIPGDDLHTLLADYWGCGEGQYRYQVLDLTGDGAPDFVVTDNCDTAGVGTDTWHVYANTGSGFAAQPTTWTLPAPIAGDDLHTLLADYWGCGEGQYRYQLVDLTGDGAQDFLVSDFCDTAEVGTDRWELYVATEDACG